MPEKELDVAVKLEKMREELNKSLVAWNHTFKDELSFKLESMRKAQKQKKTDGLLTLEQNLKNLGIMGHNQSIEQRITSLPTIKLRKPRKRNERAMNSQVY